MLLADEWHLLWGDVCGQVWGKRNAPIAVPMTNARQRQTYYGSLNVLTQQFHLSAFAAGNSQNTVAYVRECQARYPHKKLLLVWDGASYHRSSELQTFWAQENDGLAEGDWKVTCVRFAPNAPEQNPVEDVWLKGKNYLRQHFADHKTFAQVKQAFAETLNGFAFPSVKFSWYWS